MKILFFLILLAPMIGLRANEIDKLQTKQDVERFVRKIDSRYKKDEFFGKGGKDTNTLHDSFFKLDMDGDGRTDLVINGVWLIVVMDLGGRYALHNLGEVGSDYRGVEELVAIDSTAHPRTLLVRLWKGADWRSTDSPITCVDTLVCFSGGITEYNAHPDADFRFEGLKVSTTMCFGTCPVFEMEIDTNRRAWYHAIRFNKRTGEFNGKLSATMYDQLTDVLKYLQLDRLDTNYRVGWTDDQTVNVEIKYNGKVKRISDYGEIGTYGLRLLYGILFGYPDSIHWQPAGERKGY